MADRSLVRLLIADDHPIVRAGLRYLCEREDDLEVVGECGPDEVLRLALGTHWDVMVVGMGYPNISGFDVITQVKSVLPEAIILVFSVYPEEQFARRALRAGAAGYLTKQAEGRDIVEVIRRVASGIRYVRPDFAQKLVLEGAMAAATVNRHDHLSGRELQVLSMITHGRSLSEIADTLSLSVKTVSTFRSRILTKLKVRNTAELMVYAMQNGLIATSDTTP